MELCIVCDGLAIYRCTTCAVFLCKEHKISHGSKKGAHQFIIELTSVGINFPPTRQNTFHPTHPTPHTPHTPTPNFIFI